jgi:hypothetical protein
MLIEKRADANAPSAEEDVEQWTVKPNSSLLLPATAY